MQALPGSLGCSIGALPAAAFKGLRSLSAPLLVNAPSLGILLKHYASSSSSSSATLPGGAATDSSQSKARWQQETQAAEEAFHDPTAPKSAAESYAAVQQEHVNKLQGLGLNMLAAEAVHKVWGPARRPKSLCCNSLINMEGWLVLTAPCIFSGQQSATVTAQQNHYPSFASSCRFISNARGTPCAWLIHAYS
jgi:hypothetical protein